MFSQLLVSLKIYLKLPEQCKQLKLEKLLLMTYVEKTSYFEDVPSCHTMLTNTLIIYQKKPLYPNFFNSGLKILCLRNVQNFIDVP